MKPVIERPPNYRRTAALLGALVGVVLWALVYSTALAQAERVFACLGEPTGVSAVRISRTARETVSAAEIETLWQTAGESLWVGYDAGGWDARANVTGETVFYDGLKDGARWWALFKIGAERTIAYVFANTVPYADANGAHYGHHPCGGWEVVP